MSKKFKVILFSILLFSSYIMMGQNYFEKISSGYEEVKVSSVKMKHDELMAKLDEIKTKSGNLFNIEVIGSSFEGRDIPMIRMGKGVAKVFLWSQMHGDEPTATLAILDILNYFSKNKDSDYIRKILDNLQILIIPMLNPDGAEKFTRRNAQDIDINRDALRLQTPEGRILKKTIELYSPEFGFNLHDQDPYFAVGKTDSLVSIALLAPAIDDKNSTNAVRKRAKQLVVYLYDVFSRFIPGHISKYDDEFEKRAFGDNIQAWGTSTVLIESGGWYSDPGKAKIRKMNFIAIISALSAISDKSYTASDIKKYDLIQENKRSFYDLIIRNCKISIQDKNTLVDLGINYDRDFSFYPGQNKNGRIADLGDLSTSNAVEEINADGYRVKHGSFILLENKNLKEIFKNKDSLKSLLDQGVTSIISEGEQNIVGMTNSVINLFFLSNETYIKLRLMLNFDKPVIPDPHLFVKMLNPCNINPFNSRDEIRLHHFADLVLERNGKVEMVFINGIKVYEMGKLMDVKPGTIYVDR